MQRDNLLIFKNAAIADGWQAKPIYQNESIESTVELKKDGFSIQIYDRPETKLRRAYCSITAWGPDGLQVEVPECYSMVALIAALRKCDLCQAVDVKTERYSFAGRCCKKCLSKARAEHEKPGWCD